MMKTNKRTLSFFLALIMLFQVFISSAAASNSQIKTYNFDDLQISISYILDQNTVQEQIEICEDDTLTVIDKMVYTDGTMEVLINNELQKIYENIDYSSFLHAANGTLVDSTAIYNARAKYPCGFDATHNFVSQNQETVDFDVRNLHESAIVIVVLSVLKGPVGAAASIAYSAAKFVLDSGAKYLDITELKYYVHDSSIPLDMNCFHVHMRAYNITSNNKKDILRDYWEYYQYVL